MTLPPDTAETLRHQLGLVAEALGKLLVVTRVIRKDAALTGPELLLAAETAYQAAEHEAKQEKDVLGDLMAALADAIEMLAKEDLGGLRSLLRGMQDRVEDRLGELDDNKSTEGKPNV